MKKISVYILSAALLLASIPVSLNAKTAGNKLPETTTKEEDRAEARVLLTRLYDINAMDKSGLTVAEKAILGKEVKSINKQLHDLGGGVYISAGAIVLILILILVLL